MVTESYLRVGPKAAWFCGGPENARVLLMIIACTFESGQDVYDT